MVSSGPIIEQIWGLYEPSRTWGDLGELRPITVSPGVVFAGRVNHPQSHLVSSETTVLLYELPG